MRAWIDGWTNRKQKTPWSNMPACARLKDELKLPDFSLDNADFYQKMPVFIFRMSPGTVQSVCLTHSAKAGQQN
jgi:hypothetical protein